MKLVVQRVLEASVTVDDKVLSKIGKGYFVLVGIGATDARKDVDTLAEKLSKLRIMENAEGKMSLSIGTVGGEMLIVSQFTLLADTVRGNRPSFLNAARPDVAEPLYEQFVENLKAFGLTIQTGRFGADMKIATILDGPVTILLES